MTAADGAVDVQLFMHATDACVEERHIHLGLSGRLDRRVDDTVPSQLPE